MINAHNRVIMNAYWIIMCRIIQAVLGFVISLLSARYLGPSNFGLINYAASIVAFVVPLMQLGLNCTLVQEIVDSNHETEGTIIGTATLMSMISSIICIAGVVCFSSIANAGEKETIIVVSLYSILLFFQSTELIQYWFQAKLMSKYTSLSMLAAYLIVSVYKVFLLVSKKSVYWFAVSNAIDYFIISAILLILYGKFGSSSFCFSLSTAKRMLRKSKYYIISGLMVTIFAQTDRIMLKLIINDAATGFYSAAVACAGITSFVFGAIIDSARPVIFESKKKSIESYEKNISRLYSLIIYLSILQSLFMTLLASVIIRILYGQDYLQAVPALQIVVWYTTFSYIGSVRNIWLLSEGKQKYLWRINLLGASTNVVLNLLLIPRYGIIGAAIASLITQFFTNFVVGYIIIPIRKNNALMLEGLNPKCLSGLLRKIKGKE